MTYPNLSDEDITKLRDAISNILSNIKKDIRKDKLKVFGKALLALIVVAGGVTVSILFPNPITIGVLGGAATLIAGNNGVFHKTKKIKEKLKEKKKNKEEIKSINIEQSNRRLAKRLQSTIFPQDPQNKPYENYAPKPSAPPKLYPNIN